MNENDDAVILTCAWCEHSFEQPRWQYDIDVEEEGEDYEPVCPSCAADLRDELPF